MTRISAWMAYSAFGWRNACAARDTLIFPLLTYGLLVSVFASVFKATPVAELGAASALTTDDLVWYITVTEMVAMAAAPGFAEVRDAVNSGAYGATLHQPASYAELKGFEWAGRILFELPVYLAVGFGLGYAWTGTLPFALWDLPVLFLAMFLGCLILSSLQFAVGLVETWGGYARPAFMILQKILFLLGGLILPLTLYPDVMAEAAWMTPFPAVLFVPGRLAFDPAVSEIALGFLAQFLWIGIAVLIALAVQARASRTMMIRGY